MDSITINLEDKNRIFLVMGIITLELVVKRLKDVTSEMLADQPDTVSLSLGETQKRQIHRVLDMCMGNRRQAAQLLEIGRTTLYRYLKCNPRTAVSETLRSNGSTSTNGDLQSELLNCSHPRRSPRVQLCHP